MCQNCNIPFSYSVWNKRYRKDLEKNDRMMKKDDAKRPLILVYWGNEIARMTVM